MNARSQDMNLIRGPCVTAPTSCSNRCEAQTHSHVAITSVVDRIGGEPRTRISHSFPCHRVSKPCRRACPVELSKPGGKRRSRSAALARPARFQRAPATRPVHFPCQLMRGLFSRTLATGRLARSWACRIVSASFPSPAARETRHRDIGAGLRSCAVFAPWLVSCFVRRPRARGRPSRYDFELDIPVQKVGPALVQVIRREATLRREQLARRRLARRPHRLHQQLVVLCDVARVTSRDDVVPAPSCRRAIAGSRARR